MKQDKNTIEFLKNYLIKKDKDDRKDKYNKCNKCIAVIEWKKFILYI